MITTETKMESLDRAVDLVLNWPADRAKDRQAVIRAMRELADRGKRAQAVWEDYLKAPGKPGDRWSLISWVGPDRMRKLHEINLEAKAIVKHITDMAGPAAGRFDQLDEDVIVLAYRQLGDGETGPDAAKGAVESMKARVAALAGLVARIERTPPAKKVSGSRSGGKKTATKKPAKARKKPASKTAVKKKAKRAAKKSK